MLSRLNNRQGLKVIIIVAIAFWVFTLFFTLHRHFTFYSSYDQGIFNQVFWNGTHGNFFQSTLSSQLSTNVGHSGEVPNVNYHRLGQHFTPALLLWLPIYYLFPYPATLTVLQTIFVTAAGLILYVLARIYLEPTIATLIVISFYCANAILGPTLANFHDISQIPLFVFTLLLAMEKRWWWLFMVMTICILAVREDSGITLFGIGMYLILSRRYPRLGVAVCGASFIYVITVTNIVMPLFSDDVSKRFMLEVFGQYADGNEASTIEIMINMLRNPWRLIVELFTPFDRTILYFLGHWLPLAFVPAFAPAAWTISIFPLLKLLLGQGSGVLVVSIRYAMSVAPGLFYGSILWWAGQGFGNLGNKVESCKPRKLYPKFRRFWIFCICLSFVLSITSNNISQTFYFLIPDSVIPWVYVSLPEQWQRTPEIRSILAQIPPDASVSATTHIIPHLSGRREIIRMGGLEIRGDDGNIDRVDYIVVDFWRLKRYQAAFKSDRPKIKEFSHQINELTRENKYGIIDFKNGVILLQKNVPSNPKAMTAWQNYLPKLQPIIDSIEEK